MIQRRSGGHTEWDRFLTTADGNNCCHPSEPIIDEWIAHAETQQPLSKSPFHEYTILQALRRLRRQRAVPHWSLPAEIWQLMAHPLDAPVDRGAAAAYRQELKHHPSQAISAQEGVNEEPEVSLWDSWARTAPTTTAITLMHHHAAQVGHAPQEWVDTKRVGVDKNNGRPGCAGKRPAMKCCPMGKVHSRVLDLALTRQVHPQQYGGFPHRSVREPVFILWSLVWRLVKSQLRFLVQLYGNGFPGDGLGSTVQGSE